MGVLGCGHDDGIEVVRLVEHAPEVGELRRTREPLRRGVQRLLVHVAQDGHVLVGMRGRWPGFAAPVLRHASGLAVAPRDELADAVEGPAAAGDERDVQLVIQIAAAQQGRRSREHARGRQGPADELTARDLSCLRRLVHGCSWPVRSPRAYLGNVTAALVRAF